MCTTHDFRVFAFEVFVVLLEKLLGELWSFSIFSIARHLSSGEVTRDADLPPESVRQNKVLRAAGLSGYESLFLTDLCFQVGRLKSCKQIVWSWHFNQDFSMLCFSQLC